MAKTIEQVHVNLTLNGKEAEQELDRQRKKAEALNKEIQDLISRKGSPQRIKALQKELQTVRKNIRECSTEARQAAEVLTRLDKATPKELNKTLSRLKRELNGIERGSAAWEAQISKIRQVKEHISEINREMRQHMSITERLNATLNKWQTSILGVVAAFSGLYIAGRKAVSAYADMDEAMANTEKFCGMTSEQVFALNEEFKNMDTRTSREQLNSLAQEAGRLGKKTQEDIMGYVKAADILNVALSDLGEGATLSIAKLSNIFNIDDRYGTYDSMVKIGSVVNELSQNCTASKPYLVEFANRLAGVGNMANMSIQQIIAFGAVLDANGQKVEASSTAISQVLTRMYRESAKYARVVGLDVEYFSNLLKTDANEALLVFLDALRKAGDMDVLAPMFKDMGETGSRAIQTLSVLAEHIDEVRWQQQNANKAFEEGNSVLREFNIFNNTAQAQLDKAKKEIQELTIQLGEKLMPVMAHIMSGSRMTLELLDALVDFTSKYWRELLVLVSAIASYNITVNLATIKTKALAAAQAVATAGTKAARAAQLLYTAAVALMTGRIETARKAMILFSATLKANPMGLLVSAITAAAAAIVIFTNKTLEARKKFDEWKKSLTDISQQTDRFYLREISNIERLNKIALDEARSRKQRIDAANQMIAIYPQYLKDFSAEEIIAGKAAKAYEDLAKSIRETARAKAAGEKVVDLQSQKLDKEANLENLESEKENELKNIENIRERLKRDDSAKVKLRGRDRKTLEESIKKSQKRIYEIIDEERKVNQEINAIDEAIDQMSKKAESATKSMTEGDSTENPEGDQPEYSVHRLSDKELAKQIKAKKLKDKKEFKEGIEAIKAEQQRAIEETNSLYWVGSIDYLEYMDRKKEIDRKYYDDTIKFYEDNFSKIRDINVQDDDDYQTLLRKRGETLEKYESKRVAFEAEAIKRVSQFEQKEIQNQFDWKENKSIIDEIELQERLLEVKVKYLKQEQDLYAKGSKEWIDLQIEIDKTVEDARFQKEEAFLKTVNEMKKKYEKTSLKEKFEMNKKVLDYLLEQEKISLELYEKLIKDLRKSLQNDINSAKKSLPGGDYQISPEERKANADREYANKKYSLDMALNEGVIDEKEYSKRLQRIKADYFEYILEPLQNIRDEWTKLIFEMGQSWVALFADLGSGEWKIDLEKAMQSTVAVMGAVMNTITQFTEANAKIQQAQIEKRYDKEIERAQGNSKLVSRLEKEKEEKIAKIKQDATNKEFTMQVIQAVAQTATNALNAYGSAAAVPFVGHIIAPIAAAAAVAAGMVQVAAIKKQQEAAAATGYAEGGYTGSGGKYEPAGIVHKGEWVASQKLLASPVTAPIINILDRAQRSNSMASLSMDDSSYFTAGSQPFSTSRQVPAVVVNIPEQAANDPEYLKELSSVISRLNQRLDKPFTTINTMTGNDGLKKALDDYNRYERNRKYIK